MNIHHMAKMINIKGLIAKEGIKMFKVFYVSRWLKENRFCGCFNTLRQAIDHVEFLQNKLPNGQKIVFKITG